MAHHGVVQYNLIPRLTPHPRPIPSSATAGVISITVQTAQTTVRLHHIIEWSLIAPLKRKRRGIKGRGTVHDAHPVPPWETQGVCEARRGGVYERGVP